MINDEVIPKVHADEVPAIIEKYRGLRIMLTYNSLRQLRDTANLELKIN